MTRVVSIRMPSALERAVRANAVRSRMLVSQIVGLILEHSLCSQYNFGTSPDTNQFLSDTKLDIRLPDELVTKVRIQADRLQVPISVYIRKVLYAYYAKRVIFVGKEGQYTLEENNVGKTEAQSA